MPMSEDDELLRRHVRRPPGNKFDLRWKVDPYWCLRGKGLPHSQAKRALRGEAITIKRIAKLSHDEIHTEYDADMEELIPLTALRKAEVAIRPKSLTEKIVRDAPALGYEYLVRDGRVPGLALRVRQNGHKSYVLHYRIRGERKSRKLKIATAGAVTLQMARDLARDLLRIAREGDDPALRCSKRAQLKRLRQRAKYRHWSDDPDYDDIPRCCWNKDKDECGE